MSVAETLRVSTKFFSKFPLHAEATRIFGFVFDSRTCCIISRLFSWMPWVAKALGAVFIRILVLGFRYFVKRGISL